MDNLAFRPTRIVRVAHENRRLIAPPSSSESDFIDRYDGMILAQGMRSLYGGDFYNVGDWSNGVSTLNAACAQLVRRTARGIAVDETYGAIADIGCGLGASTLAIARLFPTARVIGVNLSTRQLQHARTQLPITIDLCTMDAAHLGFRDESLDHLVCVEAAFHFSSRAAFFAEAYRVLRRGGRLLMTDMIFDQGCALLPWWVNRSSALLSNSDYLAACSTAGFAVDDVEDITHISLHPFCHYLRTIPATRSAADELASQVSCYFRIALRKNAKHDP